MEKVKAKLVVECPECFEDFRVADHDADWVQTCPECGEMFEVELPVFRHGSAEEGEDGI